LDRIEHARERVSPRLHHNRRRLALVEFRIGPRRKVGPVHDQRTVAPAERRRAVDELATGSFLMERHRDLWAVVRKLLVPFWNVAIVGIELHANKIRQPTGGRVAWRAVHENLEAAPPLGWHVAWTRDARHPPQSLHSVGDVRHAERMHRGDLRAVAERADPGTSPAVESFE